MKLSGGSRKGISRRNFLAGGAIFAGLSAAYAALPRWMPRFAFAQPYDNPGGDVLIPIFLRGGADALNMIVPHAEEAYYAARPRLAIPRPDAIGDQAKALDIDGFFGLHPALEPLLSIMRGGELTVVHAAGSPHETRSHFEAMDFMERGTPGAYDMSSGWIGRHLISSRPDRPSPIRGIGWGTAIQRMLAGGSDVVAMKSIIDYHLDGNEALASQMMEALVSLYALEDESIQQTANSTIDAIELLQRVGYQDYAPRNGAVYPQTDFALALRQTAALIRADVGLEVACIDLGGWDTHATQGNVEGVHARLMMVLAEGLAAFHQDMETDMWRVVVLVMSEFGRRASENGSAGTDHGHGGAIWLMSANLAQPGVVARWPGLAPDALDLGRDLAITLDYRDVLIEVLRKRLRNPAVEQVFPGHTADEIGLFFA